MDPALEEVGDWARLHVDLPGFGRSPLPDSVTSTQTMADALLHWLSTTLGNEPFALIGSSFGGLLARFIAWSMPRQVLGLALL